MLILVLVVLFYGFVGFAEGMFDGERFKNGEYVEHNISFWVRVIGAVFAYICLWACPLFVSPLIIPMMLLLNSIGVDFGFNYGTNKSLGYIGRTSKWDKFIRKTPIGGDGILYQLCKLFLAGVLFFIVGMI